MKQIINNTKNTDGKLKSIENKLAVIENLLNNKLEDIGQQDKNKLQSMESMIEPIVDSRLSKMLTKNSRELEFKND